MKTTLRLFLFFGALPLLIFLSSYRQQPRTPAAPAFKVVGYVASWAGNIEAIQYNKLTHINYAFLIPTDTGGYRPVPNPVKLANLVALAHQNNVKVLVSLAGGSGGNAFRTIVPDPKLRAKFISNMVFFAVQYNLDGIDVDWEYPRVGAEADNFLLLMQELTAAMHKQNKLCTIAVVGDGKIGTSILSGIFDTVDYLMIMAYDDNRYQHSSYDIAVRCMNYWKGRGLPASKTVLGVPFYARDSTAEYKTAKYKDVLTRGGSPNEDTFQTVGYNGIPTMRKKTELAFAQGSGIMIWELDGDPIGPNSLLSAINEVVVSKRPARGGRQQQ